MKPAELSADELRRYSRHLTLPGFGAEGQERLKNGSVLIIGTGGLGSPAALYLAAAGVGRIGLVDFDVVDASNLQRQIIHATADIGRSKLLSAKEGLEAVNPHVMVEGYEGRLCAANAKQIVSNFDVVIDGTDNFATRYLVNDACVMLGKPNVYGSVYRFDGQASVFWAAKGPCYRCLYPEPPPDGTVPNCAEGGVLGILPGVIGTIQATEAVKLIAGIGEPMIGRLLLYNALTMRFRELKLQKDPNCPVCGANPTIRELADYGSLCGIVPITKGATEMNPNEITPRELKQELDAGKKLFILDVREPNEYAICKIPGSHLIPLGELERRVGELDRNVNIVAHCKAGGRSAKAVKFLLDHGFTKIRNLTGGILAWSDQVDPSVPKY